MFRYWALLICAMALGSLSRPAAAAESADTVSAIVCPASPLFTEELAAREIRRYVYLRTGKLLPIVKTSFGKLDGLPPGGIIAVGVACRWAWFSKSDPDLQEAVSASGAGYLLKTIRHEGRPILVVTSGSTQYGPLYAAYRLAEHLGVRFYLHGDVVPDQQVPLRMPQLDEVGRPLFALRGIQPFHDFPEGPDWWNADAYKAILAQLPKLRMNFFALHTYPEGGVGPEPLVWIGTAGDCDADGKVKSSYPSRHFTTSNVTGAWGYRPMKTSDYSFGAAALYERDDFGADYMEGTHPWNQMSPEACNELFNRMGGVLRESFTFAHRLGITTCVGTETPLIVPRLVRERLKAAGKNPADPAVIQELYEGMFERIKRAHPLDYYWFWTPEGWTWQAVKQEQIDATLADFRAAIAAAEKVEAPFTLATCGWVLGPQQDRALFDNALPKKMPMSCISREVGHAPVEPGFAKVEGRPKWAIPWLEDDPAMIIPQLWAGRMRKDAADALGYGCTGLMGIHWRTRILGPNVAALAAAAWDQDQWNPARGKIAPQAPAKLPEGPEGGKPQRHAPTEDFYADWAAAEFGPEAAKPLADLFARIDGRLPRPSTWVNGPGGINPDPRPWDVVAKEYAFVEEMAAMQPLVKGPGNLERFDYWLSNFRYLRAVGQVNCTWARYNEAIKQVKAEKDPAAQKKLARQLALPIRKELVACVAEVHRHLLATVSTPGELGTVTNWQQHIMPTLLTAPGEELAKLLGEPLPADAVPSKNHLRQPRLFVPVVRTILVTGEPLRLTVIMPGLGPQEAAVYWRPLGTGEFKKAPLGHVARGVYRVTLPPEASKADLEYYVEAHFRVGTLLDGSPLQGLLRFPPTAPAINQTVVVTK